MSDPTISSIQARFIEVTEKINTSVLRSGRKEGDVHLVVVTKTQTTEAIRAVIAAGAKIIGENYPEEADAKINKLGEIAVEWHMIGHVQSRKADLVTRNFSLLHSLDSVKLAAKLDRQCSLINKILPVLIEVNVSGESSKYGYPAWEESCWSGLIIEIENILRFSLLKVCGLMTMPPYFDDPVRARPYFTKMLILRERLQKQFPQVEWKELSMGSSMDFTYAIEEGATIVRVGQSIFGPRQA